MFECKNCGCRECSTVYEALPDYLHRRPGRFAYVRCTACGLLQIREVPPDLADHYQGYRLHGQDSRVYRAFRRALLGHCYPMPRGPRLRLLDVGCGNGWYIKAMARRGWEVCGYEFDPEYARQLSHELGLEVLAGTEALQERTGAFDLVTFHFSFEHLTEPVGFMRLAHSLIAPAGRIYLSLPNPESTEARVFGSRWLHLDPPRHICLFSKRQIKALLEVVGFDQVKTRDLPAPTGFAGSISCWLKGGVHPMLWYAAMGPGVIWSLLVGDGNFAVTARKP